MADQSPLIATRSPKREHPKKSPAPAAKPAMQELVKRRRMPSPRPADFRATYGVWFGGHPRLFLVGITADEYHRRREQAEYQGNSDMFFRTHLPPNATGLGVQVIFGDIGSRNRRVMEQIMKVARRELTARHRLSGRMLKLGLKRRGMPYGVFSRVMGLPGQSRQQVSGWVSGRRNMTAAAKTLAAALARQPGDD